MKKDKKIKVFCDFDGTIAQNDISDEIFKKFGNFNFLISQLKSKEIDIKEYWKLSFDSLPDEINIEELIDFINDFQIDPYFEKFYEYCNSNEIEFFIVSDGFDFYINSFLSKHNLHGLNIFSNKTSYSRNNRIMPIFLGATESCNCFTANCKRNIVLNNSDDNDIIIYIGDGYSDYCGAEHSDIIFAKKNLAAYCNENRLPHYPFKNFFDILRILKDLMHKNIFKKRNQSILKRNSAFMTE